MKKEVTSYKLQVTRGFTLIEMIVSLAIFSIVAVVALGALTKIISANKKAQSLQSAMTNLNFTLESMSREMRVGSNFRCAVGGGASSIASFPISALGCSSLTSPTGATNGQVGAVISFISSKQSAIRYSNQGVPLPVCNLTYTYRFVYDTASSSWDIQKAEQDDSTAGCQNSISDSDFSSMIDPNVIISSYYINVTSATYPLLTIRLSGYVGAREKERSYFDVQTAVSARLPSGQ